MRIARMFYIFFVCVSWSLYADLWYGKDSAQLAVISVPVIDLFIYEEEIQDNPPASPEALGLTCKRAHQGLANEVVTITRVNNDRVQISFENLMYGIDEETGKKLNTFWIKRENLIFLKDVEKLGIDTQIFPAPRDRIAAKSTLVLTFPYQKYSIGTRFVCAPEHDTVQMYGAQYFDPKTKQRVTLSIPRDCCRHEEVLGLDAARELFVQTLNQLLDRLQILDSTQIIPYVWGGSSFVTPEKDGAFVLNNDQWVRPNASNPITGYDCSELVLRFAAMSGLPYPFKTTRVLDQYGQQLRDDEALLVGDIIWIPGHVMIVSNLERNELIDARGYGSGYGKVCRLTVQECFKDIVSYDQLRKVAAGHHDIHFVRKDGSVFEHTEMKFFKPYRAQ